MNDDRRTGDLLSGLDEIDFMSMLLADLHDDLAGKIARFRQLADLAAASGAAAAMIPGGEIAYAAYVEARSSFVHGNYVATVLLCQSFAEQMLAANLALPLNADPLPARISFHETLKRCQQNGVITNDHARDLERLIKLRNPLSHYRDISDPTNLSRRSINAHTQAEEHLRGDASFAIGVVLTLLALPSVVLDRNLSA